MSASGEMFSPSPLIDSIDSRSLTVLPFARLSLTEQ